MKNNTKKNYFYFFTGLLFFVSASNAYSQDCDSYPYQPHSNVIEFDGAQKFKILSTAAVPVDFDDPTEVSSARREAELLAKRSIAEYINQKLTSEDKVITEINKSKTHKKATDGSVISTNQRDEIKKQLISISTRADAVLKGAITIGSCYTKGHEVRVTVGIKSQTVTNAGQLGKTMGVQSSKEYGNPEKVNTASTSSSAPVLPPSQVGTKSYNDSKQLQKF